MSTSLVMMDTGAAHRRMTSNSDVKPLLVSSSAAATLVNSPLNFAMKFAGHHHLLSSQQHQLAAVAVQQQAKQTTGPVSVVSAPQHQIKLDTRIPSPCTGDLALKQSVQDSTRLPSPNVKDFSFYLTKSASQLVNGANLTTTLAMKPRTPSSGSDDFQLISGQTVLPNGGSPSPPPLLKNGGHYFGATASPGSKFASVKRNHEEAFSSITSNSSNGTGCQAASTTASSPSSPPGTTHLTNGHQSHSLLTNGASIASPTSSTYSDFGKEEMSPSNSVNGYASVDSLGGDKKKKGPAPRQQEELCLVCGDRASGYHYNALTCEGCKGFFRRSITKNAVYQCKYGNNCEIDMYMRRKCQECRLKKCLSVGMRPECVVPEYQCAIKREAKRAIKDKDKPNSTTKDGHLSPNTPQPIIVEDKQPGTPLMAQNWNGSNNGDSLTPEFAPKMSNEQEEVIKKLVYYQDEFESPSEDDVKKIAPFPLGENEEDNQKRFQHVTEMTILTVQLIVEFSKRVPYFDTLYREDQITLLKACSSEVMMLRCSRKYDIRTDSIVYANNQPYTRDNYNSASISYTADALFNFCRRMCMLKVDNAEYALLTAIVIFSDRPQLIEPHKVEEIQEKYIETLRAYVESHRPPNRCHFAKLLGILTELRTLGNINSEMCVSLKVQNKKLPPFLAEIWDIQDS